MYCMLVQNVLGLFGNILALVVASQAIKKSGFKALNQNANPLISY